MSKQRWTIDSGRCKILPLNISVSNSAGHSKDQLEMMSALRVSGDCLGNPSTQAWEQIKKFVEKKAKGSYRLMRAWLRLLSLLPSAVVRHQHHLA
jgi:hypothetical protein